MKSAPKIESGAFLSCLPLVLFYYSKNHDNILIITTVIIITRIEVISILRLRRLFLSFYTSSISFSEKRIERYVGGISYIINRKHARSPTTSLSCCCCCCSGCSSLLESTTLFHSVLLSLYIYTAGLPCCNHLGCPLLLLLVSHVGVCVTEYRS